MQRFQRVFQAMEQGPTGWVEVAVDCGYYDQAHLIRDFREFTGKPPTALEDGEIELAREFAGR
jgi:transcriptional regulator GlxA family with amidase domain